MKLDDLCIKFLLYTLLCKVLPVRIHLSQAIL